MPAEIFPLEGSVPRVRAAPKPISQGHLPICSRPPSCSRLTSVKLKTAFISHSTRLRRFTLTLDTTPYGTEARVVSVSGDGAVALRLMQMGVVPGVSLSVVKSAPLGDPIQVRLRDYDLAMRRVEAKTITVTLSKD